MKTLTLVAALFFAAVGAHASGALQPYDATSIPNDSLSPRQYTGNLDYFGADLYSLGTATAADQAVLLFSGSGFLYGITCSSGAVQDFGLAIDTPAIANVSIVSNSLQISPTVFSGVAVSSGAAASVTGNWAPPRPARIHNGLVGLKHGVNGAGANERCEFWALSDATVAAPTSH